MSIATAEVPIRNNQAVFEEFRAEETPMLPEMVAFGEFYEDTMPDLYRFVFYRTNGNRQQAEAEVMSAYLKYWQMYGLVLDQRGKPSKG